MEGLRWRPYRFIWCLRQLPILGNCESPLKFQVRDIIIINELRDGIIMAARYHTGWRLLLIELLLIYPLIRGVWGIAPEHFLILAHSNSLSLDNLDILQPTQDLMLYNECRLDAKHGALLDCEWFTFQRINGSWCREINCDIRSILNFEGEGLDDAFSGVGGVRDRFAGAQT